MKFRGLKHLLYFQHWGLFGIFESCKCIKTIYTVVVWLNIRSVFPAAFPIQTVEAEEGDNVFFQCQVDNQVDVSDSPVTWSKDDRRNIVHVYIRGRDRAGDQKEMFRNRTLLFHEGLRKGNVTLQLSSVRLSDKGTYTCYIRRQLTYCSTVLKVGKHSEVSVKMIFIVYLFFCQVRC